MIRKLTAEEHCRRAVLQESITQRKLSREEEKELQKLMILDLHEYFGLFGWLEM